jgi:hypothetical protein
MTNPAADSLKKTPLHASHVALGARMVPFGGWDMPVEYSGITAEHLAVRTAAGLFDVSHMGEVDTPLAEKRRKAEDAREVQPQDDDDQATDARDPRLPVPDELTQEGGGRSPDDEDDAEPGDEEE